MEDKKDHLSDIDLFRDLSERDMAELHRMTTITNVLRGRVFYRPEDVSEVLFLLKEGRVQLYRISSEGKKLVLATLGPGTLFGEMALLGQRMQNAFAEALDDCVIMVISRTDLERLTLSKSTVGLRILQLTRQAAGRCRRTPGEYGIQRDPGPSGILAVAPGCRRQFECNCRLHSSGSGRNDWDVPRNGHPGSERHEGRGIDRNRAEAHRDSGRRPAQEDRRELTGFPDRSGIQVAGPVHQFDNACKPL